MRVDVGGTQLEVQEKGSGSHVLVLHGLDGPSAQTLFIDRLAERCHVWAPSHPGFGNSPLPDAIDSVDDLAYVYLDLLEALDLRDVTLVGTSLGAWIGAELATKSTARLSRLILANPLVIKVGDRESRDIPDIYALGPDVVDALMYSRPEHAPDASAMDDDACAILVKERAAAALYVWEPYMHNPKLTARLRRIDVPTLVVRGADDGLISEVIVQRFAAAVPGAQLAVIAGAGHCLAAEQPDAFAACVLEHLHGSAAATTIGGK